MCSDAFGCRPKQKPSIIIACSPRMVPSFVFINTLMLEFLATDIHNNLVLDALIFIPIKFAFCVVNFIKVSWRSRVSLLPVSMCRIAMSLQIFSPASPSSMYYFICQSKSSTHLGGGLENGNINEAFGREETLDRVSAILIFLLPPAHGRWKSYSLVSSREHSVITGELAAVGLNGGS